MAGKSKIEWCDATWNPVVGCSHISPGCDHCYAERMAHRLGKNPATPQYAGLTGPDGKWTGETRFVQGTWSAPLTWRKYKCIFVCSMGDLFHESVPFAWVDRVFSVMALAPQHTFLLLTKRPERMREYFGYCRGSRWNNIRDAINHPDLCGKGNRKGALEIPFPNIWLGVTAENQAMADERIPILLDTTAAKRFVSVEPVLGPVHFSCILGEPCPGGCDSGDCAAMPDWVVAGGETGPGARPANPDWVRSLRDQCGNNDVPFFFKGWGEWCEPHNEKDALPFNRWREFLPSVDEALNIALKGHQFNRNAEKYGEKVAFGRYVLVGRFGKKYSGRLLDGQEYNSLPGDEDLPF